MDESKISALFQLAASLEQNAQELKRAYDDSNKENFDSYKKIILDAQKKIDFLLK